MIKNTKTLLEYGSEGGSIGIYQSGEDPNATYLISSREVDLDDNFYKKETVFQSFDEAYEQLYLKYKLIHLHLDFVQPDLIILISELINKIQFAKNQNADKVYVQDREKDKLAVISSIPVESWQKLSTMLDSLTPYEAARKDDMPLTYLPEAINVIYEILEELYEMNIIFDFSWSNWDEGRWLMKGFLKDFSSLPPITLVKLATAVARSDRFYDEAWLSSFEHGQMQNILKSLIANYVTQQQPH